MGWQSVGIVDAERERLNAACYSAKCLLAPARAGRARRSNRLGCEGWKHESDFDEPASAHRYVRRVRHCSQYTPEKNSIVSRMIANDRMICVPNDLEGGTAGDSGDLMIMRTSDSVTTPSARKELTQSEAGSYE